jgi:hypothetical protein
MKRFLLATFLLTGVVNAQPIVEHQIGDDGFVEVPLQFGFPYYGQLFTNSWMFDNGVVGFYSPFNGYNGGQQYFSQPFSAEMGGQFSYMIAPLWTDLVNYSGTFTTQGNSQFQTYNWNNISQWGYPENLNTFSLEIRPSGEITVTYDQVNISGYPVSTGTTGDVTQGEFEQMFYAGSGSVTTNNNLSNWSASTDNEQDTCNQQNPECPEYLKNFITELDNNSENISTNEDNNYFEEVYENTQEDLFEEFIVEDNSFEEESIEELIAQELNNEESTEEELDEDSLLSLLELIDMVSNANDKPIDSHSSSIVENQIAENYTLTNNTTVTTVDTTESVIHENAIRIDVTQLTEQNTSYNSLIAEITDEKETQVEDTETIVDNISINDSVNGDLDVFSSVALLSSASNINETNMETLLSGNAIQENNTEVIVAATEQVSNEEVTSVENIIAQEETEQNEDTSNQTLEDVSLTSSINLDVVTTAASTFSNNSMQQVLALGGTITEILNTPVPDFSRYEVKPPSQDEEVQTARVENTLESMSTEEIESQAELRIGSMDPQAQAVALQLIGYKPGFDQYDGMLVDQSNWYLDRGMYTNNRVPSSNSNLIFGAQDQRHQELMSLQYRR